MTTEEHITEWLPDYVLDLLDPGDKARLDRHLAICPACQEELAAYNEVVGQLALAVPQAEPPAYLKDNVLSAVSSKLNDPSPAQAKPAWQDSLVNLLSRRVPAWGVVSLALILILGISNLFLWRQVNDLRRTAVTSDTLKVVNLVGTDYAPAAIGMLVISANGEYGTLVVDRLPALDAQHQYQLWLIRDGVRTDGGVFSVSDNGYGVLPIDSTSPLTSFPAFGVTIEPDGGSSGPTGEKVLGGQF
jgi:anti-sigma-K factor RskA